MGIGPSELWIILIIIIILFGGSKIPEIMKGLGKGIKEFKKAKDDMGDDDASKKEPKDPASGNTKT
jgi:sec-independent protein translocase protein TatA